jgi:uncharacterized membrane protein
MSTDKQKNLKDKLESLKDINNANHVDLDTSALYADKDDFPVNDVLVGNSNNPDGQGYVDYKLEKENFSLIAEQTVDNIIRTYIKSDKLLNSSRLMDLKQYDIRKYSRLILMTDISERNLLSIQENIDLGDLSKEMFDSINKAQTDLRKNMEELDKHLAKMEKYWGDYASKYGFENEEEKIANEDATNADDSNFIIDQTSLIEGIHNRLHLDKNKKNKK